ncbi:MAG: Carbamoyl-phosphate synthase large chain [Candidatus Magnetoglobus multicellularis str. Araruama]|uniref:Carbamoyl phosphate synthase arginine-specific large chain, chloroplastic n=1 Tax=Candidatus Magnetoglobus multicellularis str. Araruama TaxID=890399 RepID=A0A1V1P695_9BACT|nr:MAG: Carbamoyl-phosphate synthase large chain [Candidatus Magnetoglobus multicellularis str. Araruama]
MEEYELEVMRDINDNVVIVCSIENMDPMGIHTGDSVTVAPAQTLTDKEFQEMRNASIAIMREIGVETGGSNVQFAVNPDTGEQVVIEMNPRVSRSSALASKATGFPIAKIAAKLAVGYTLDEIPNDITRETLACFEPTLDYCVVKIPRWTFEKFPETPDELTTSMRSVGETMAIGRTFKEAFQKGLRSLEIGRFGLGADGKDTIPDYNEIERKLAVPNSQRIFYIRHALMQGFSIDDIFKVTSIDRWFLFQIKQIVDMEEQIKQCQTDQKTIIEKAKKTGFSDYQIAHLLNISPEKVYQFRKDHNIRPVYKLVDTCAAEFQAATPYYYSTYEEENEARMTQIKKVVILGGGPNRIGQGIEFDYCCVHASFALRDEGIESIMVNSNPETVSTDYDTSDKLYFEPLTFEDVMHIIEMEKPDGVIVQFGGQTPLNLVSDLYREKVPILGTQPESIDRAEDRELFQAMLKKLNLVQPDNGIARSIDEAIQVAEKIGYPVVVRPSYVLGGRAMKIVYNQSELADFTHLGLMASPGHPVLIDKFVENAVELDVDAISDGTNTIIGGIMEHIEEAGVHSGDSACFLPPRSISDRILSQIMDATKSMAQELSVVGLMNVQYAIQQEQVYVLEVNPRASRTIPFVSKATGVPLARLATQVMLGHTLNDLGLTQEAHVNHFSVKEVVLPFDRFPGVDTLLGPEMKSTGEVMGIDTSFGRAFLKAQLAAGQNLPKFGSVFISVKDTDKPSVLPLARQFIQLGFTIYATHGTALYLTQHQLVVQEINKVSMGSPHVLDAIKNNDIQMVINTGEPDAMTIQDGYKIRRTTLKYNIPYTTTIAGARGICTAIADLKENESDVSSIQFYHG